MRVLVFFCLICVGCGGDAAAPDPIGDSDLPSDTVAGDPEPTPSNSAPEFGRPVVSADHNRLYEYDIQVSDDDGDEVAVTVISIPEWMEFDPAALRLSGIAGWERIGTTQGVNLEATDGSLTTKQSYSVSIAKGEIVCDQDFGDPAQSQYVLPYHAGKEYTVIQSYCPSNPNWGHYNTFAYDFDTAMGDTIVASRGGEVRVSIESNEDGTRVCGEENLVYIRHDDGTIMSYVHLMQNGSLVEVGDIVEQGDPIALSGDSGCSTGPHLHTQLWRANTQLTRKDGLPVNYSNAEGPLDSNQGLMHQESYTAQ